MSMGEQFYKMIGTNKLHFSIMYVTTAGVVGLDGSDRIATRYGLDGLGIISRWEGGFAHPSTPTLDPIQPPVMWLAGIFPGGKAACAWR
jgi:hypothetical protein